MKRLLTISCVMGLVFALTGAEQALGIALPDGTVTANRHDYGTVGSQWWGESVTTVTIDAQNVEPGQHLVVSGKITDISSIDTSWIEIGLIQKEAWDHWQGGGWESSVFDKGLYVVHWTEDDGIGLQLKEGWWEGSTTMHLDGPYAWGLAAPTAESPWQFTFTMHPTTSGDAFLYVPGETVFGDQPLAYSGDHGYGDFSESFLIAQIWSLTEDASFSFTDVHAIVVPEPGECIPSAAASTLDAGPVHGTSDLAKHLAYFLLPIGVVIGLSLWRRKR